MRVPLSQPLWLAPVTQPIAPWGAADRSSIGRQRNSGEDVLEGTHSGYRPASSHWNSIRAHSALACGESLWSNKWHWFWGGLVFVAVCISILSNFDMWGRGWAVMWKMTPLSARQPMMQGQNTAGNPAIKALPSAQPHYNQLCLNWGLFLQLALTKKDASDCSSHLSQHPL